MLRNILTRIARDALHGAVGILQTFGGVDVDRRRREPTGVEETTLAYCRERLLTVENELAHERAMIVAVRVERDFFRDALAGIGNGVEPICAGAILYGCDSTTPCVTCAAASRLRVATTTTTASKRVRVRKTGAN